ncbi:MAG: hypothetical protein RL459_1333 [Pseudomonadota bacterium]
MFVACSLLLGACGSGGGEPGTTSLSYRVPAGLVVKDLDGDGLDDVMLASSLVAGEPPHPGVVEVYLQTAPGLFGEPQQYAVGPDPWGLGAGDLNGDGWLDLVVATPASLPVQVGASSDSGGVSLLVQNPSDPGRFLPSVWLATGGAAQHAAISYLNNDALADLVVADGVLANARALVYVQNSSLPGTYAAPDVLVTGGLRGSRTVVTHDLNGDGRNDVVLAATDSVVVFYQLPLGGFGPALVMSAGLDVHGVAVADLDGDGRADIVAANAGNAASGGTGGASLSILRQTAPGAFASTTLPLPDGARQVAIADLNADGLPDLAAISLVYQAQNLPSYISVVLQSRTQRGQFSVYQRLEGPMGANFLALGDANGDQLTDIFVNDGPVVFLQSALSAGSFDAPRPLRSLGP